MEQKQLDELDETPLEEYIEEEDEVEDFKAKKKAIKKPKKSPWKDEASTEEESSTSPLKEQEEDDSTQQQSAQSSSFTELQKEPINPWSDNTNNPSTSKGWIILCVILTLLLIMAIFTGGFGMIPKKQTITQQEAEARVLAYVNTELLRGDTKATLVKTLDDTNHYIITLQVNQETVDTYLTKDGEMFFPQGFALANIAPSTPASPTEPSETTPNQNNPSTSNPSDPVSEASIPVSTTPTPKAPARTIEINLAAKKWLFTPTMATAAPGDHIKMTITPTALDFTFAIPELKIEKEITKTTVIEFDVPVAGNYTYSCSSCEDYRGMTGKIIVE